MNIIVLYTRQWDGYASRPCPCLPRRLDAAGARAVWVYAVADTGRMRQECNQLPQMFLPLFVFLYLPHNFYSYFSRFTSAPSARLLLLRPIYAATAASTSAQCAAAASAPAAACSAAAASIDYHRQLRCHQRTVALNEAARQAACSSLGYLRRSLAALSSMTNRALFLMVFGCCPR